MIDLSFLALWSATRKLGVALMILLITSAFSAAITGIITYYAYCVPAPPRQVDAIAIEDCDCDDEPKPCATVPMCKAEQCRDSHPFAPTKEEADETCLPPCPAALKCAPENCGAKYPTDCSPAPSYENIYVENANNAFMKEIAGKNPLELLNQHPVGSNERLQTALVLLKLGIQPYHEYMSRRNCRRPAKVCTICNDHYKWLRCVVNNELIEHKHPEKLTDKLFQHAFTRSPHKGEGFSRREDNIKWFTSHAFRQQPETRNRGNKSPLELGGAKTYFEDMLPMQISLTFVTDKKTVCTVCEELNNAIEHMDCIMEGGNLPWIRAWY